MSQVESAFFVGVLPLQTSYVRGILKQMTTSPSMHSARKNPAIFRISARGAWKRPFSVSEKCGTQRQTQVSKKFCFYGLNVSWKGVFLDI